MSYPYPTGWHFCPACAAPLSNDPSSFDDVNDKLSHQCSECGRPWIACPCNEPGDICDVGFPCFCPVCAAPATFEEDTVTCTKRKKKHIFQLEPW